MHQNSDRVALSIPLLDSVLRSQRLSRSSEVIEWGSPRMWNGCRDMTLAPPSSDRKISQLMVTMTWKTLRWWLHLGYCKKPKNLASQVRVKQETLLIQNTLASLIIIRYYHTNLIYSAKMGWNYFRLYYKKNLQNHVYRVFSISSPASYNFFQIAKIENGTGLNSTPSLNYF